MAGSKRCNLCSEEKRWTAKALTWEEVDKSVSISGN